MCRIDPRFHPCLLALLAVIALGALPASADPWTDAWAAADEDTELLQNSVYLLLRVAGLAWIAIEWIAAIILVRAFYQLQRWVRRREAA